MTHDERVAEGCFWLILILITTSMVSCGVGAWMVSP